MPLAYLAGMLGNELRKARDDAKMTQEQLSFAAEIDRTYVSMLENNKKSPTVEVLFRICKALGVSASEVIARVEQSARTIRKK